MKKTVYVKVIAFLFLFGCSKSPNDYAVNQDNNQMISARTTTILYAWDNNNMLYDTLRTAVWPAPAVYTAPTGYPLYVASNYDVMTHFQYFSHVALKDAVIEFTFPQIKYFVPHITKTSEFRIYKVNNINNQTVITCTTDLVAGWNGMFCFIVKVDCGKGKSGYATIWTDMKINGVSVKGTIKNKVFACN